MPLTDTVSPLSPQLMPLTDTVSPSQPTVNATHWHSLPSQPTVNATHWHCLPLSALTLLYCPLHSAHKHLAVRPISGKLLTPVTTFAGQQQPSVHSLRTFSQTAFKITYRNCVTVYWQLTSHCYSVLAIDVTLLQCAGNCHTVTVYWQLTSHCYSVLATDITLLQCTGNWRHTVTVYLQLTSHCYSELATDVTLLQFTGNWRHTVTVYWQLTSHCYSLLSQFNKYWISVVHQVTICNKCSKYPPPEWSMDMWTPAIMDCHIL